MPRPRSRRDYLALAGAAGLSGLAGCGGLFGRFPSSSPTATPDTTPDVERPAPSPTESPTATPGTDWDLAPLEHDRLTGAHYYPGDNPDTACCYCLDRVPATVPARPMVDDEIEADARFNGRRTDHLPLGERRGEPNRYVISFGRG